MYPTYYYDYLLSCLNSLMLTTSYLVNGKFKKAIIKQVKRIRTNFWGDFINQTLFYFGQILVGAGIWGD